MFKLWSAILKDFRLLLRDKVGLLLMFVMPVLLVIIITNIQNSAFNLVSSNKVSLLFCNKDKGEIGNRLRESIVKTGMFDLTEIDPKLDQSGISDMMKSQDALVTVTVPPDFSSKVKLKAEEISGKALGEFGVKEQTAVTANSVEPIFLYYNPVLQESFRKSITEGLGGALQMVESKQILQSLYFSINQKELPASLENSIVNNQVEIKEIPMLKGSSKNIPNATQHNVPAWTVFAMFFMVVSLGSNIVKEKLSGSAVRLRTLPTSYALALLSKQITYLVVSMVQVVVIFSIGMWVFPSMGLPPLNLPEDKAGLFIVSLISGWCAVSYAMCLGVFSNTQEQSNGFGAVSIVILSALGGIMVPAFAMPESFALMMKISPLHWCLNSYYGLFLEGGKLIDVMANVLPIFVIIMILQAIAWVGLKRQNLI